MTNRILDFSKDAVRLRIDNGCLAVRAQDGTQLDSVPLTDIESVILSNPAITVSQSALASLASSGVSTIVCDAKSRPVGMVLPLEAHQEQRARFLAQAALTAPRKKRLWQSIVRAKISAQARTLEEFRGLDYGLRAMAKRVGSGDPANVEAQAARCYWLMLFPEDGFRRRDEEDARNHCLDYGYAVLRAGVARALCASGLHPSLSVHHRSPYNTFPLADDLMEPFRPAIDRAAVLEFASRSGAGEIALDPQAKRTLIGALTARYRVDGESRTLLDLITRTCRNFTAAVLSADVEFSVPYWTVELRKDVNRTLQNHVDLCNVRSAG